MQVSLRLTQIVQRGLLRSQRTAGSGGGGGGGQYPHRESGLQVCVAFGSMAMLEPFVSVSLYFACALDVEDVHTLIRGESKPLRG